MALTTVNAQMVSGALTADSSGNVGIGISPAASRGLLQVYATGNQTDESGAVSFGDTTAGAMRMYFGVNNANSYTYIGSVQSGTAYRNLVLQPNGGNLLVGTTSGSNHIILKNVSVGSAILGITNSGQNTALFYATDDVGNNTANAGLWIRKVAATNRSINAAGTVNASGADYAEYMTKAGDFTIAKGDVVGIDANGKLTNVFADAISFVVKSTDPSYVGGDVWFTEEKPDDESLVSAWEDRLEIARSKVDRIAFSGQVPVNVTGATAGQYIIPVNDNNTIKGEAVSNPTLEQYQIAVGKVIAIEADGRAKIIVKVA